MTATAAKRIQESTGASIFLSKNVELSEVEEERLLAFVSTATDEQAAVVGILLGSTKVRDIPSDRVVRDLVALGVYELLDCGERIGISTRFFYLPALSMKARKETLARYIELSIGEKPTGDEWIGLRYTETASPRQVQAAKDAGLIMDPPQFYSEGEDGSLSFELPIPTNRGSFWIRQGVR